MDPNSQSPSPQIGSSYTFCSDLLVCFVFSQVGCLGQSEIRAAFRCRIWGALSTAFLLPGLSTLSGFRDTFAVCPLISQPGRLWVTCQRSAQRRLPAGECTVAEAAASPGDVPFFSVLTPLQMQPTSDHFPVPAGTCLFCFVQSL